MTVMVIILLLHPQTLTSHLIGVSVADVLTWDGEERERENVCCGNRPCVTTKEYFLSTALDHNVLTLTIRLHADFFSEEPNYQPNGFRKAAYRQYILSEYGYLGPGHRRVAPSCVVRCVRMWFPSPDGYYMGYRSEYRTHRLCSSL